MINGEKRMANALPDDELSQVSGSSPEENGDPFAEFVPGDVYESKYYPGVEYCRIGKVNNNNGVIDYWPGVRQGDHIQRIFPLRYATPGTFRKAFKKKVTDIPWHDF